MISQIGCITVPEETLTKVYEGKTLTADELRMVDNSPKVGHDLIARIPRLEPVADIIAYQERLAKTLSLPEQSSSAVLLGAHILNLALDFDKLIEAGLSSSEAFTEIRRSGNRYNQLATAALSEVVEASETMYAIREVNINNLTDHSVLAEDIKAANGVLLVAKGQEVTASLRVRLENFLLRSSIHYSVKVFVPIETPAYRRETPVLPIATEASG